MAAIIKDYEKKWKFSISNFQEMAGQSYKLLDGKNELCLQGLR